MNLTSIPATFAPDVLVNLAASQLERNTRIARMLVDTTTKAVAGSVERNAQLAVSLNNELGAMVLEATDAAANLAQSALVPFTPAAESAKAPKK